MAIYTIAPSTPFFETLAEYVLRQSAHDYSPLSLARTTIFLPTRRACKSFERVLLAKAGTPALIMPRILPVRDVAEDNATLLEESAEIAPVSVNAISPLQRLLVLSRLVLEWKQAIYAGLLGEQTPKWQHDETPIFAQISHAECVALAQDLARTLDQMTLEEIPITALADAIPTEFFDSSELNLAFLNIIMQKWPEFLAEHNLIDPIVAWDAAIRAVAQQIEKGHYGRVIAAGSTGSTPATAQLLAAIARSENGTLVLPGLDMHMSTTAWQQVDAHGQAETHPQIHLKRLLTALYIKHPEDVPQRGEPQAPLRESILSHALQPVLTTDEWNPWRACQVDTDIDAAMAGVALIEAAHEEEEALSIALLLRDVAADEHKTAALVTPNRTLSRRVSAHLRGWGIDVPDSGGTPLVDTPMGRAVRLLLKALQAPKSAADALALLRHPMVRIAGIADMTNAVSYLERALFRGIMTAQNWPEALEANFAIWQAAQEKGISNIYPTQAQKGLKLEEWQQARLLLNGYMDAIATWQVIQQDGRGQFPLTECIAAFADVFARLMPAPITQAEAVLYALIMNFLKDAQTGHAAQFHVPIGAFASVFEVLLASAPSVPPVKVHSRIILMGSLEARLHNFDCVVLSGLNEGIWPPASTNDAWLGRPMRAILKMPMPERRIALSAHDFMQFMGHRQVFITRALRENGTPTLASRFLQRLSAVLGDEAYAALQLRGSAHISRVRALSASKTRIQFPEPMPIPALHLRPRKLSVTKIEALIQNPYAIYVEYVLKLKPFETIQESPDARVRGSLVHSLLEHLARIWADQPEAHAAALTHELQQQTAQLPDKERLFWRTQFQPAVAAMVAFEQARRPLLRHVDVECSGEFQLNIGSEIFTINGRIDRLEARDGGAHIIDFKTGQVPQKKYVLAGLHPQLVLLAAMVEAGGFGTTYTHLPIEAGEYVGFTDQFRMMKSQTPLGEHAEFAGHSAQILHGVRMVIANMLTESAAFRVKPYRSILKTHGDYDHLARLNEWGIPQGEETDDE